MKVSVETELCIGCALCESSCPEVFEMNENVATVKNQALLPELVENVRSAAKECPVEAIVIEE